MPMTKVKMFLFVKWLVANYSDILNTSNDHWYKEQMEHFNHVVWQVYLESGVVEETNEFLKRN
jgi:hypothetical protein